MAHKYKRFILLFEFLLGLCFCFSCVDNRITSNGNEDVQYVDTLLTKHIDSIYAYPAQTRHLFEQEQKLLTDSQAYYKLQLYIGYCQFLQTGTMDSLILINRQVMDYCHRHDDAACLEAVCWNHRSIVLHVQNTDKDSMMACLHHAYEALYRSPNRIELTSICINLADNYRLQGDLVSSAYYYHRAQFITDSLQNYDSSFAIYVGLGQTYTNLQNYTMAEHYYAEAAKLYDRRLDYEKYHYETTLGNCYYYQKKYKEALQAFRRGLNIARTFHLRDYEAPIEVNLGELYTLLGQFDSAHYYLNSAQSYITSARVPDAEFYLNSLLASLALHENDLNTANRYLSRKFDESKVGLNYIYLHNKRLMDYYEQKKDYKTAFLYKEKVERYDDSLRNVLAISNISEIDQRYKQDTTMMRKDLQIAQNEAELNKQYTISVFAIALLAFIVLLVIFIVKNIRHKNELKYNQQLNRIAQLRMQNVRNRISPHFVFNVLNSVMPKLKQYTELWHPLQLLIEVLRGNLLVSENIATELGAEIDLVKKFVELRAETNNLTPKVEWKMEPDVPLQTLIPAMLLQIPVENAMKYAFEEYNVDDLISIAISDDADYINMIVQDNGLGYDPSRQIGQRTATGTGTGLKVLYQTIELLNHRNIQKIIFDIENLSHTSAKENGTRVTIRVPLTYEYVLS